MLRKTNVISTATMSENYYIFFSVQIFPPVSHYRDVLVYLHLFTICAFTCFAALQAEMGGEMKIDVKDKLLHT